MKKFFFACALSAASLSLFAFAPVNKTGSYKARETFKASFGQMEGVNWESGKRDLVKASFMINDHLVTAFFDGEGELVATTISMDKSQLPAKIQQAIDKQLAGVQISEIFSVETPDGDAYFISTQGGQKLYKAQDNGSLREVSKQYLK